MLLLARFTHGFIKKSLLTVKWLLCPDKKTLLSRSHDEWKRFCLHCSYSDTSPGLLYIKAQSVKMETSGAVFWECFYFQVQGSVSSTSCFTSQRRAEQWLTFGGSLHYTCHSFRADSGVHTFHSFCYSNAINALLFLWNRKRCLYNGWTRSGDLH